MYITNLNAEKLRKYLTQYYWIRNTSSSKLQKRKCTKHGYMEYFSPWYKTSPIRWIETNLRNGQPNENRQNYERP